MQKIKNIDIVITNANILCYQTTIVMGGMHGPGKGRSQLVLAFLWSIPT